jgi:hypothetical protein
MAANVMAGDAEAAGAIAGMQELYGRPYEVDQWVSGCSCGKAFSGRVIAFDGPMVVVEIDDEVTIRVNGTDIHEPLPAVPMDVLVTDPSEVE